MANSTDGFDILRCAFRWRFGGAGDIVMVVDLQPDGLVGTAMDSAVVGAVEQWGLHVLEDGGLFPLMSNLCVHEDVAIYNLTDDYPVGFTGRIAAWDGSGTAEALPPQLAALLTFRTSTARRLGRKYLPPFTVTQLDDGRWGAGTVSVLRDLAELFTGSSETAEDWDIRYVVRSSSGAGSSLPTSYIVRDVPSTQRSRKIGVGS